MSKIQMEPLLKELKLNLKELYAKRLCGIYVFGSYARGGYDAESDLDILIVLSFYERYSTEIERTGDLVSTLSLKYGVSISRKFISETQWATTDSALLRNVRSEAVAA
jgi:predicted nucleotidyltransferase